MTNTTREGTHLSAATLARLKEEGATEEGATEEGTQEENLTTPESPDSAMIVGWGNREEVREIANRIRRFVPGGNKLSDQQCLAFAQYARITDANPVRGEIYAWDSKGDGTGDLVMCDGYKLLTRWANKQAPFSQWYEDFPADKGDIGKKCFILRQDQQPILQTLIQAGAPWKEAVEMIATTAIGIVTKSDMWSKKYKCAISPPKGWTWGQVAEKRALKNTLCRSHGMPSPGEIARESWMVGDTATIAADWEECTPEMSTEERARLAAMHARARQQGPDPRTPEQVLKQNGALLHGTQVEI